MIFRKGLLLLMIGLLCISCDDPKRLENRIADFAKANHCELKECTFRMTDITWFSWDTMYLYQDEIGLHCDFKHRGHLVYSYQKDMSSSNNQPLNFGFGDKPLKSFYTSDNCNFKLIVQYWESNRNSKVYFIMPNDGSG